MLSDHERQVLGDVERRLMADDPEFARSFEARQARLQRAPRRRGSVVAVVVAVLPAVLMLPPGAVTGALGTVVATVSIWATWRGCTDTQIRTALIPAGMRTTTDRDRRGRRIGRDLQGNRRTR